jgi:hypothetical protein
MKTYRALVSRDGKWWMIEVPKVDGVTQARRLADVEQMARELIAVTIGTKISEVAVELEYQDIAGTAVNRDLAVIRSEKAEAARLEQDVAKRTSDLVRALVAEGIPIRDIGQMLGMSFQRVHQLAS